MGECNYIVISSYLLMLSLAGLLAICVCNMFLSYLILRPINLLLVWPDWTSVGKRHRNPAVRV